MLHSTKKKTIKNKRKTKKDANKEILEKIEKKKKDSYLSFSEKIKWFEYVENRERGVLYRDVIFIQFDFVMDLDFNYYVTD